MTKEIFADRGKDKIIDKKLVKKRVTISIRLQNRSLSLETFIYEKKYLFQKKIKPLLAPLFF